MPINGGTILTGPTISVSGGTSSTLSSDGQTVTNGVHVADAGVADFRVRPHATYKTILAVLDKLTKKWGKGKRSLAATFPRTMADGTPGFPVLRISLEDYPEMSDAELTKMLDWGVQFLQSAHNRVFWKTGSVS